MATFTCSKCNHDMRLDRRDTYYDLDYYKCDNCGHEFTFRADFYYIPDDDELDLSDEDWMDGEERR